MVKIGIAIGLALFIASLSVLGSPFFAILFVAPAALLFSVWAGAGAIKATEDGQTEGAPANEPGGDPEFDGRPAGTAADRAFRRKRAALSQEENSGR